MKTFSLFTGSLSQMCIALLLAGSMVVIPLRASAIFVPTFDPATQTLWVKEYSLDAVAKAAMQMIINQLLNSITNWASGGGGGNPKFTLNPKELLSRVQSEAGDVYAVELSASTMCQPYPNFQNEVLQEVRRLQQRIDDATTHSPGQLTRITACDLDRLVTSGTIQNYLAPGGYASEGGDAPLLQVLFSRKDDPSEQAEVAKDELKRRTAVEAKIAEQEKQAGSGYENLKECAPGAQTAGGCKSYDTKTPGINIGDTVSKSAQQSTSELSDADELTEMLIAAMNTVMSQLTNRVMSNAGLR